MMPSRAASSPPPRSSGQASFQMSSNLGSLISLTSACWNGFVTCALTAPAAAVQRCCGQLPLDVFAPAQRGAFDLGAARRHVRGRRERHRLRAAGVREDLEVRCHGLQSGRHVTLLQLHVVLSSRSALLSRVARLIWQLHCAQIGCWQRAVWIAAAMAGSTGGTDCALTQRR